MTATQLQLQLLLPSFLHCFLFILRNLSLGCWKDVWKGPWSHPWLRIPMRSMLLAGYVVHPRTKSPNDVHVGHGPRQVPHLHPIDSIANRNPASTTTPAQWPPVLHPNLQNRTFYNSTKISPFAFKLKILIYLKVFYKIMHLYPCI